MKIYRLFFFLFIVISLLYHSNALALNDNEELLTLQQAEEQALMRDPLLSEAKLKLEIAAKDWETAKRFLSLSGSVNLQKQNADNQSTDNFTKSVSIISGGDPLEISPKWSISASETDGIMNQGQTYNISISPFNFGQKIKVKEKEVNLANLYLTFETARLNLLAIVRTDYGEIVQKLELTRLANENLQLAKEHLNQTNALFETGKIPRLELLDAEQQVNAAENNLTIAELNREEVLLKLSADIGRDDLTGITFNGETLAWAKPEQIDFAKTLKQSLTDAPDVMAAIAYVELAKINLSAASYYQLNGFNIGASLFKPEDSLNSTINTYKLSISGALDDTPFITVAQAKKNLKAAESKLEFVIRELNIKINETYRLWKINCQSMKPLQKAIDIAKERLRIASLKYSLGLASGADVIKARQDFIEVEGNYWQSWFNLQQARENFYQAVWGKPILFKEEKQ